MSKHPPTAVYECANMPFCAGHRSSSTNFPIHIEFAILIPNSNAHPALYPLGLLRQNQLPLYIENTSTLTRTLCASVYFCLAQEVEIRSLCIPSKIPRMLLRFLYSDLILFKK